jgi:SP family facilitated glucose transporter-like MFS transporter 8
MTIGQCRDVENGGTNSLEDLEQPFIKQEKIFVADYEGGTGSIGMVLLSTCVAVCGSFEFGSCVSILDTSMNI